MADKTRIQIALGWASLLLPFAQIFGGAVMLLVALQLGLRVAALSAMVAAAGLSLIAVLIGDSANDTRAAQAAGMPVICVTYGYNRGIDVRELNPDAVIDSLKELPDHIRPG